MIRRSFLASGLAALAQTADPVPTALIGTGNRGGFLLGSILKQPGAKLAMLCDLKADRLDKAATTAAQSNPTTTKDWRQVIERKDIGAVFIATPPHLHAEMAIAALKAGKHVYCEKPVATTPADLRALVAAVKASGKVFVSGQQLRSMVQLGAAVQRIREGAIGEILFVKAQRHATADLDYNGSSGDWYYNYAKSGGYLVEQSVHNLDACNWVIGEHPARCAGFGGIQLHKNEPVGRDIYDHQSLTYEYPSGIKLSFTQMVFHPRSMPAGGQYINVYGSKGAVELMSTYSLYTTEGKQSLIAEKVQEDPDAHTRAFFDAISKGMRNPADITIGATAALTAIMGNEACRQGRVVKWEDLGVAL